MLRPFPSFQAGTQCELPEDVPPGGVPDELPDVLPGEVLPDVLPGDEPVPVELEPEPDEPTAEGEVLELDPDGLLLVAPDEERGVAVEPALGEEVEPLLLEPPLLLDPELSHAPKDTAESSAAAISNLLSITLSPYGFSCSGIRSSFSDNVSREPITGYRVEKFRSLARIRPEHYWRLTQKFLPPGEI